MRLDIAAETFLNVQPHRGHAVEMGVSSVEVIIGIEPANSDPRTTRAAKRL